MASDDITRQLRRADYLRQYFAATGREYATGKNIKCPNAAAHAHGDANPSASIYENPDGALVKCHGCGGTWDIFSLWQLDNGGTFPEAKRALCDLCGIARTSGETNASRAAHTSGVNVAEVRAPARAQGERGENGERGERDGTRATQPDKQTADYITKCALNFQGGADGEAGRAYLAGRGISIETARRFNVGYDAKWKTVIIPQGAGYAARTIDPNAEQKDKIRYYPTGTPRVLFNGDGLRTAAADGIPVFIVEGEVDALSIAEGGGVAVSTGGTSGIGKAVKAAAQIGRGVYVPCMDRDEAGEKAQAKLVAELRKIGGEVYAYAGTPQILMPDAADGTHPKDANDALRADAAAFKSAVAEVVGKAQEYAKTESNPFNKERNGVFLRRLSDIPPPIDESTDPDALIKGYALAKGEGWILAGEPGAGKSSFIMQLGFFAAAGKPLFGMDFMRPLKVFYLQTELQERKIKLADNSFQYAARTVWGWTDGEYEQADGNFFYDLHMIGNTCDKLPDYLVKVYSLFPFDLLLLDPLLTYTDDDPSLVKPMRELLYKQVTSVMGGRKATTPDGRPVKFATVIAHHMGKTRYDNGKKVDRGQYATAGSYVINAWARIQLNLSKCGGNVYELSAAKNPDDCTLTDENGNHAEKIFIKRAGRGERYWTQATKEEAEAAQAEAEAAKSGATPSRKQETDEERKRREDREYRQAMQAIVGYLQPLTKKISKTELRNWCIKTKGVFGGFQSHTVKKPDGTFALPKPCYNAFEHFTGSPEAYGVACEVKRGYTYYGGVAPVTGGTGAATATAQAEPSASATDSAPDETDADELIF